MYKNKALNALSIIGAVFLSIILVVVLFATVTLGSFSSAISLPKIIEIASDSTDQFVDELAADLSDTLGYEVESVDSDLVSDMLDTDEFKEVFVEITDDLKDKLENDSDEKLIDEKIIRKYIKSNSKEIAKIIKDNVKTTATKSEIKDFIDDNASKIAEDFTREMPTVEEFVDELSATSNFDIDESVISFIVLLMNGGLLAIMIIITVLVTVGLFFTRFKKFGGLKWVGISGIVASAFVGLIVLFLKIAVIEVDEDIVIDILTALNSSFSLALYITFGVSLALLITGIVVGRIFDKKEEKETVDAPVKFPAFAYNNTSAPSVAPVQTPAAEAPADEPVTPSTQTVLYEAPKEETESEESTDNENS